MRRQAIAPDGTAWEVTATRLPWRPRRRRIGGIDLIGTVLFVVSFPLWLLEWAAAGVLGAVRSSPRVVAVTDGPPAQRLIWRFASAEAAREKAEEITRRIAEGEDVAREAHERSVSA